MIERPKSVSVIAWIIIVIGFISLIMTYFMMGNPEAIAVMKKNLLSIQVQYAFSFIGSAVMIVAGVAMLRGLNWARLLYVGWTAIAVVIGFATSPMKAALMPSVLFVLIIAYFLFGKKANEYFIQEKA